jgi:hypothetical protein
LSEGVDVGDVGLGPVAVFEVAVVGVADGVKAIEFNFNFGLVGFKSKDLLNDVARTGLFHVGV